MAKSSNPFKASDELKKRIIEKKKAMAFIDKLEEILNAPNNKLSEEILASAQASLNKLKEISAEASAEINVMMSANEEAQMVLDLISEKLNAEEVEPAPAETAPVQEHEAVENAISAPETPDEEALKVKEDVDVSTEAKTSSLTEKDVQEIFEYSAGGYHSRILADMFNVSEEEINRVLARKDGEAIRRALTRKDENFQKIPVVPAEPVAKELTEEEKKKQELSELLHHIYSSPRYTRIKGEVKVRFNAVIKPSLVKKMRADQQNERITSPSDLINGLLEIYYGEY